MEEFFAQGDREKELGIVPIAMHDRDRASAAQSQVGFIEFVVGPLCAGVIRMFPPLAELGVHLVEVRTTLCTRRLELSPAHAHARRTGNSHATRPAAALATAIEPSAVRAHVA